MAGFLFDHIIFGPINSRRLGLSLGVNLLPLNYKYCSFNCIYCECGWTKINEIDKVVFPPPVVIKQYLEKKLSDMKAEGISPDAITFAGNGEPTLHPDFAEIIDDTIQLRNNYFPESKICVLSNSTMLHLDDVVSALKKVDIPMLKLDAGNEEIFRMVNKAVVKISLNEIVENMMQLEGKFVVQSLFLKGVYNGTEIDNTKSEDIKDWIEILKKLKPLKVVIYPVARATPAETMDILDTNFLNSIAEEVRKAGLIAEVYT